MILRKLIFAFKYKYSKEIVALLGEILCRKFEQLDLWGVAVPIPLHRRRLRERGFNQAALLAGALGMEVWDCLERRRSVPEQAGLGRGERLENLRGVMGLREGFVLRDRSVVLVDDVATTGSTLNEAARVLKEGGVEKVVGLVLARGD